MPTPPDFKANALTPEYLWNEKAAQYINKRTGKFVSRDLIRGQLDKVIDASTNVMAAISQQLRDGDLTLAEWQTAMMKQIKVSHLAAGAMQRGGWQQMTQADYGRVGRIVRDEYAFLRDFANDIASGKVPLDGRINVRARLYGQQARSSYYQFWDNTAETKGFDEERSILNPAEHCKECIDEAAKGFQPLGKMIPIGRRICRSNDKCDKEYRNSVTGEVLAA